MRQGELGQVARAPEGPRGDVHSGLSQERLERERAGVGDHVNLEAGLRVERAWGWTRSSEKLDG